MISLSQRAHLVTLYGEPHRHYHTLDHIMHCLRELGDIRSLLSSEQASIIKTAIWYHDAVYDPKAPSGVNERESADLLYFSAEHVPIHQVADLILSSWNHKIPDDESEETRLLLAYFLDIDLAILGQSEAEYDEYARKIRAEYAFVPEDAYREGRRRVLLGFLGRSRIYFSDHFHAKYEDQARRNLSREILSLVPDIDVKVHEGVKR